MIKDIVTDYRTFICYPRIFENLEDCTIHLSYAHYDLLKKGVEKDIESINKNKPPAIRGVYIKPYNNLLEFVNKNDDIILNETESYIGLEHEFLSRNRTYISISKKIESIDNYLSGPIGEIERKHLTFERRDPISIALRLYNAEYLTISKVNIKLIDDFKIPVKYKNIGTV
jgi:hypothetical protein